jgi:transposase
MSNADFKRIPVTDLLLDSHNHSLPQSMGNNGQQFPGEDIHISVEKSYRITILGFINKKSQYMRMMTESNIGADTVIEYLEKLFYNIKKKTVLVLDNAGVHKSRSMPERIPFRQQRGLFITFPLPYPPHLNITETVWRKIKKEWMTPEDYPEKDRFFYAANRWLAALGKNVCIKFRYFI